MSAIYTNRKRSGQSTIEFICGTSVLVPVVICLADISIILTASIQNHLVCREVSRAAAAAPPSKASETAASMLRAIVITRGLEWCHISLAANSPEFRDLVVPPPDQGGVVEGRITVRTESKVRPPFLVSHLTNKRAFELTSEQEFSCTYVVPVEIPEQ